MVGKANLLEEVWNGYFVLTSIRDWSILMSRLKSSWGIFVADYFYLDLSGLVSVSRWKSIDSFPVGQEIKSSYVEELNKRQIFFSKGDDELIWIHSKSGGYTVKDGYKFLSTSYRGELWPFRIFWHIACLPKACAFAWLSVQDRVLTGMRLDRLGITIVFPCVLCGCSLESIDHLFFCCPFASKCWYCLFGKLNWSVALCGDIHS